VFAPSLTYNVLSYDPTFGALYGTIDGCQIIRIDGLCMPAPACLAAGYLDPVLSWLLPAGLLRIIAEYSV
jgi:hypothetical protein